MKYSENTIKASDFFSFKMYWKAVCIIKTKYISMIGLAVTHLLPLINRMPYARVVCAPTLMAEIHHHVLFEATLPMGYSQAVTEQARIGRPGHFGR